MSIVRIKLKYTTLSQIIEEEANKSDIQVRSHSLSIRDLDISKNASIVYIKGKISSKWNADFNLQLKPSFNKTANRLQIDDLDIQVDAQNFIFNGIMKLAKGNILKRIEQMAEEPVDKLMEPVKEKIDEGINSAKLPYALTAKSKTNQIDIQELLFNKDHLFIEARIEQTIEIEEDQVSTHTPMT